ncbi:hypothetical protein ACQQ97_07655 [Anaerovoracaceae bacterium SGI.195]
MDKEFIKSEDYFSFELNGEESIDASELSQILRNTVEVVENLVPNQEDTYVNLKVTKFSTGSFDIDFSAICEQVKNIINSPEALATIIVASVSGAFGLVKHLKGEKPERIVEHEDRFDVVNCDGEKYSINKALGKQYFKNSKIENSVINIVNIVKNNERDGFQIKSKRETVKFAQSDINSVAPIVGEIMNDSEHEFVNTIDTTLIIRKPDLVGRSKWGFIFDKNIEATIEDKEWLTKIHNEKTKFGMGMKLPVKLKIIVPLDNNSCPIGEPTYVVVKVTGDIQEIEDNQIALPV